MVMPMPNTIGMSVPGATALMPPSPADQVANETEEQRRKRLQKLQAARQLQGAGAASLAPNYGAAFGGGV
jgi:hypothetical protein